MDLTTLNKEQRVAVTSTGGPVVINAGPGTGKTKTLVFRIEYLLVERKVPAEQILALTFTRKAAAEMRDRLTSAKKPLITTFHGFAYDTLQKVGYSCEIISEQDKQEIVRTIVESQSGHEGTKREIKDIILEISNYKNSLNPEEKPPLIEAYDNRLKLKKLMDYDDLILTLYNALKKKEISVTNQYSHVLVDEFQDTNRLQYEVLKMVCSPQQLFFIGDPYQSIYSFRGADAAIFKAVSDDFPETVAIRLKTNYRSTKKVIDASTALFSEKLTVAASTNEQRSEVHIVKTVNEYTEADFIVQTVNDCMGGLDLLKTNGVEDNEKKDFSDFAVIYRTHSMKRALEQAFFKSGIPFQVVGGDSPYGKSAIKLITHVLQYCNKPTDESLGKILQSSYLTLSRSTRRKIKNIQLDQAISYTKAVTIASTETHLIKSEQKKLSTIRLSLIKIVKESQNKTISQIIHIIYPHFAIEVDIDLQQYISCALHYEKEGLSTFMDYISYLEEHEFYDSQADTVTLMTIHASKGLEFDTIYIVGFEEGIIPYVIPGTSCDEEEEKRLLYVAMTRAKNNLWLLYTEIRGGKDRHVSRFKSVIEPFAICRDDVAIEKLKKRNKAVQEKKSQLSLF